VPSPQRVRADQETPPPLTGQGHGRRREEGSIRRGEQDPPATSAEDFELVADHGILEIWFIETATEEKPEQPAQEPVSDGPEHLGSLMPGRQACEPGQSGRSSFFTPQCVLG